MGAARLEPTLCSILPPCDSGRPGSAVSVRRVEIYNREFTFLATKIRRKFGNFEVGRTLVMRCRRSPFLSWQTDAQVISTKASDRRGSWARGRLEAAPWPDAPLFPQPLNRPIFYPWPLPENPPLGQSPRPRGPRSIRSANIWLSCSIPRWRSGEAALAKRRNPSSKVQRRKAIRAA